MARLDPASPSHRTLRDPPTEPITTPCRRQFKARSKPRHPRPAASRGVVNPCIQTRPLITPLSTVQSAIESKSFIRSLSHPPFERFPHAPDPGITGASRPRQGSCSGVITHLFRPVSTPYPFPRLNLWFTDLILSLLCSVFIGRLLSPVKSRLASCA